MCGYFWKHGRRRGRTILTDPTGLAAMALREDSGVRLATVGESRLVANSTTKYTVGVGLVVELDGGEIVRGGLPMLKEFQQGRHEIRIDCLQLAERLVGDS